MGAPLSQIIEGKREPLAQARVALAIAEADLNGIVARLGARNGDLGNGAPRAILRKAVARVHDARDNLDILRLAAMGIETIAGRDPAPNDHDDMLDAVLMQLERIEAGVFDDESATDAALIQAAHRRGADVAGLVGEAA